MLLRYQKVSTKEPVKPEDDCCSSLEKWESFPTKIKQYFMTDLKSGSVKRE